MEISKSAQKSKDYVLLNHLQNDCIKWSTIRSIFIIIIKLILIIILMQLQRNLSQQLVLFEAGGHLMFTLSLLLLLVIYPRGQELQTDNVPLNHWQSISATALYTSDCETQPNVFLSWTQALLTERDTAVRPLYYV